MRHGRWPGTWQVCCDVCGFDYPSDEIRKRWDGLYVCQEDWEPKHPQLNIRVPREHIAPPFVRPEPPDTFRPYCTIFSRLAIPGLGIPGCIIPASFALPPNYGNYLSVADQIL